VPENTNKYNEKELGILSELSELKLTHNSTIEII